MNRLTAAVVLSAVACSSSTHSVTAPKGLDPTVSFKVAKSSVGGSSVAMSWWSQSGQVQRTVVAVGDSVCIRFESSTPTDSVRFEVLDPANYSGTGAYTQSISPWFDPTTGVVTSDPSAYPFGAEYWVFVWGGELGPAYGADSSHYATVIDHAPC
jgi:hypothetical protein